MDHDDPRGHMSLAVHEAAHAVVAWRSGLKVEFIKLEYGWWSGDLQGGFNRVGGNYCEEESLGWAATTAAGALAQEKYLLQVGVPPHEASKIAEYGGSLDADDMVDMVREFGVSESAAHAQAGRLVDAHWPLVLEVAVLLNDRGRVSGRVAK